MIFILAVSVATGGCAQNRASTSSVPIPREQAGRAVTAIRPGPGDIAEFEVDALSETTHFEDFKVAQADLEDILLTWYEVSEEHWRHGYSHVAFGDRTGTIELRDGRAVAWLVRPGGLATLTFPDGTVLYLAKEVTPWGKDV